MNITINFDLDGTLANLYGVPYWLDYLLAEDTTPYEIANPLIRLSALAKELNSLQKQGYKIAIISWLSKNSSQEYEEAVIKAKKKWLFNHLPSVHWDEINIIPYGTPKQNYCRSIDDILFDDTPEVRNDWTGLAYTEKEIFSVLKNLLDFNRQF